MNEVVIDGSNAMLGRLASYAAKQALLGKKVIVLNCKQIVISGDRKMIVDEYKVLRAKGGSSLRGPIIPRSAEKLVKRTVRGMLPYKQKRGLEALERVWCYNEVPAEYTEAKKIKSGKEKNIKTISLQQMLNEL